MSENYIPFSEALELGLCFPCVRLVFSSEDTKAGCLLTNAARALGMRTPLFASNVGVRVKKFLAERYPWTELPVFAAKNVFRPWPFVGVTFDLDAKDIVIESYDFWAWTPAQIIANVRALELRWDPKLQRVETAEAVEVARA